MKLIWNNKKLPPKLKDPDNRLSTCKWYMPCVYTKWEIIGKAVAGSYSASCVQARYCVLCGKTQLRKVNIF